MSEMLKAPEGVEFTISLYLVSPTSGLEAKVNLGGLPMLPTDPMGSVDVMGLLKAVGGVPPGLEDARPMTRAEILDYRAREDDEDEE